jgi:methylated-DNA-[protein]-cysteine S-methyltransferase
MPETLHYRTMVSQLGPIHVAGTRRGLCRVSIGISEAQWLSALMREGLCVEAASSEAWLWEAVAQLQAYLRGELRNFRLELDLSQGSPFAQRVWEATAQIPYGELLAYGQVARAIGSPRSTRAVGGALSRNPVPIIVPCHRVIRGDGRLGGFALGSEIKRMLLEHEGVDLDEFRAKQGTFWPPATF